MAKMKRQFIKNCRQTGARGKASPLHALLMSVMSAFKHVEADFVGSSSGKGIEESGKSDFTVPKTLGQNNRSKETQRIAIYFAIYLQSQYVHRLPKEIVNRVGAGTSGHPHQAGHHRTMQPFHLC